MTVRFDEPVVDDPNNPYGQDLLVFGNTGLVDIDGESGIPNGGVFGADGGDIYVSADGIEWFLVPDRVADGVWPTLGYLDAGPYDECLLSP